MTTKALVTSDFLDGVTLSVVGPHIVVNDTGKIPLAQKGAANGVASLDSSGRIPSIQMPSYVDTITEYPTFADFPTVGVAGVIYVDRSTEKIFRWGGSLYIEVSPGPGTTDSIAEGSTHLYYTDARARASISATGGLSYNSTTGVITGPSLAGYVTTGALSTTLGGYTTTGALATALSGYVSTGSLASTLSSYALNSALSNYATTTALSACVTDSSLSSLLSSYATTADLSSYVAIGSLTYYLGSYALTSDLSSYALISTLSSYALTSSLSAYAPKASPTFTGTVGSANLGYTGTFIGGTGAITIGTNQLVKDTSGHVGIGVGAPDQSLTVVGTAYTKSVALTDAATITWDASAAGQGQNVTVTLAGNRTVAAPTNLANGAYYCLNIVQDATGSRTLAFNAIFKFVGGLAPTLSTVGTSRDYLHFRYNGTYMDEISRTIGDR